MQSSRPLSWPSCLASPRNSEIDRTAPIVVRRHEFLSLILQATFLKGGQQQLDQAAAAGVESAGAGRWLLDMWGDMLAYYGHLRKAREKWQGAVDVAMGTRRLDHAAQHEAGIAVREFLFGNTAEARVAVTSAQQHCSSRSGRGNRHGPGSCVS